MLVTKDGEQTVLDGETHTTFVKSEKFDGHFCQMEGLDHFTIQRFQWIGLTGNPFKDCWMLLRWYFSKG